MLGIAFFKDQPTDYIIKYVGGRVTKEGLGRAFYYLTRNTQIVVVPTSTQDAEEAPVRVPRDCVDTPVDLYLLLFRNHRLFQFFQGFLRLFMPERLFRVYAARERLFSAL